MFIKMKYIFRLIIMPIHVMKASRNDPDNSKSNKLTEDVIIQKSISMSHRDNPACQNYEKEAMKNIDRLKRENEMLKERNQRLDNVLKLLIAEVDRKSESQT